MGKIKDNKIIITNKDGMEEEYEVLFTCKSSETNKNYLVYSTENESNTGEYYIHVGSFDPSCEDYKIEPVTDEKEWDTIMDIIQVVSSNDK